MPRSRSSQPHLEQRKSGFYWRRRWPASRAERVDLNLSGKEFSCFSLRTISLSDAKTLARRLTAMSDQVFAALTEKTMPLAPEIAEHILVNLARFEIEAFERTRAAAPYRSAAAAHADLHRETVLQETLRQALLLRDRDVARAPLRNIAQQLGITLDEEDLDWQRLAIEATRVLLDVSQERHRRDQGIYNGPTVYFRSAMARNKTTAPDRTCEQANRPAIMSADQAAVQFASSSEAEPRQHERSLEKNTLDLSRFCAAPGARLSHLPFEGDWAFPAQC